LTLGESVLLYLKERGCTPNVPFSRSLMSAQYAARGGGQAIFDTGVDELLARGKLRRDRGDHDTLFLV
jgi:hypothetical protein